MVPNGNNGNLGASSDANASITPNPQHLLQLSPLANYTLPGVISYLTSEFTSLERFKIITNLEKSEMKYRILQLTSELNSLKYVNDKQALRIKELEKQLLKGSNEPLSKSPDVEIPPVDLEILRKSRAQLNKSIREVVKVLKPPTAINQKFTTHPELSKTTDFDELLEENDKFSFEFDSPQEDRNTESMFARYITSEDFESPDKKKNSFEEDAKHLAESVQKELEEDNADSESEKKETDGGETDTETVIVDEAEGAGVKLNENEVLNSRPDALSLGTESRILSSNCIVYPPFQNSLVLLDGKSLSVLQSSEPVFKGTLEDSADILCIYYLEKKRFLVISTSGVSLLTYTDENNVNTKSKPLVKEEKTIKAYDLVEPPTSQVSNKVFNLAYATEDKNDSKSVVTVMEVRSSSKVASRVLALFNSSFLGSKSSIRDVKWVPQKGTSMQDAIEGKSLLVNEPPSQILILHNRLQKLDYIKKKVTDLQDGTRIDSILVGYPTLVLVKKDEVDVYNIDEEKLVSQITRKPEADYALIPHDPPIIVESLKELVFFDSDFNKLLTRPARQKKPKITLGDSHIVVTQDDNGTDIVPVGPSRLGLGPLSEAV